MRLTHVLVCKTAADPQNDNTQKSSWFKQQLGTSLFALFLSTNPTD
jgi:hypothetical protein